MQPGSAPDTHEHSLGTGLKMDQALMQIDGDCGLLFVEKQPSKQT